MYRVDDKRETKLNDLEKRGEGNLMLIGSLLRISFTAAHVSSCKMQTGGRKFRIAVAGREVFLCVSLEYLNDQREADIRKDFGDLRVADVLSREPERAFLLSNESVRLGKLERTTWANARCGNEYEDVAA